MSSDTPYNALRSRLTRMGIAARHADMQSRDYRSFFLAGSARFVHGYRCLYVAARRWGEMRSNSRSRDTGRVTLPRRIAAAILGSRRRASWKCRSAARWRSASRAESGGSVRSRTRSCCPRAFARLRRIRDTAADETQSDGSSRRRNTLVSMVTTRGTHRGDGTNSRSEVGRNIK